MMQQAYVWWWVVAIALVGLELTTGTFYLMVYGVAATAGGVVAWLGGSGFAQFVVTGIVAVVGTLVLNRWRRRHAQPDASTQDLETGHPVTVVTWQGPGGLVRYRGAEWDARAESAETDPAKPLFIRRTQGNTLVVGN